MRFNVIMVSLASIGLMGASAEAMSIEPYPQSTLRKMAGKESLIAQRGERPSRGRRLSMFSGLSLTEDQLERIVALKNDYYAQKLLDKARLKAGYRRMFNMITKPDTPREEVEAVHKELLGLKNKMSNARLKFVLDSMNVLSSDQKKEIRHSMLVRQLSRGEGRGRGGRRWSGGERSYSGGAGGAHVSVSEQSESASSETGSAGDVSDDGMSPEQFLMMLAIEESEASDD